MAVTAPLARQSIEVGISTLTVAPSFPIEDKFAGWFVLITGI